MSLSINQLRKTWNKYKCERTKMVNIDFGPGRIRIAPPTVDAFKALASIMNTHNYNIRKSETDSYNCRIVTGGTKYSLHSYGIALDVNGKTNPYITHSGKRKVRYSDKPTQSQRAEDVKRAKADTDMTPQMIEDILNIKTINGIRAFRWGGDFKTLKDAMHFTMNLTPKDLAKGLDWSTVKTDLL